MLAPIALFGSVVVDGVVAVLPVASGDSLIAPLAEGSVEAGGLLTGGVVAEESVALASLVGSEVDVDGSLDADGSVVAEPLASVGSAVSLVDGSVGLAGSVAIDSVSSVVGRSLVSSVSDCAKAGAAKLRQTAKRPDAIRW